MTSEGSPDETPEQRKRRLDRIFGDVLPEQTSDDADQGGGSAPERTGDDWLRGQVPPHHG